MNSRPFVLVGIATVTMMSLASVHAQSARQGAGREGACAGQAGCRRRKRRGATRTSPAYGRAMPRSASRCSVPIRSAAARN